MNQKNDTLFLYLNCFADREETKYHYWKSFDRLRESWIKAITSKTWAILKQELDDLKKAIRSSSGGKNALERSQSVITSDEKKWKKLLPEIYLAVGNDFRERIWNELERQKYVRVSGLKTDFADPWADMVYRYMKKVAVKKIRDISATSRNMIRRELYVGIADGEGNDKLADRIDEYLEPTYRGRAMNIARTETCGAAGLGGQTAAKETGLELEKEWYASKDEATREAHDLADGQRVPIDEPYEVDGEELMFPGDTSMGAGAGNVCRCRCTELYYPVKEGEG